MGLDFNISLSGLMAAQRGMNVANQNVSNMNTEGYVRQRVELKENPGAQGSGKDMKIGSGVLLQDVKRMTDEILTNNYNSQNSNVAYFKNTEDVLTELETVFAENTTGSLNNLMGNFFASWEELSKFPEESAYYYSMVGETQKFTQKLNEMGKQIDRISNDTIDKTEQEVSEVNGYLKNIADINMRINEYGKNAPNPLLDERDRLINKLSSYMKIDVSYESTNPNIVSIRSGGSYLVDRDRSYDISMNNENNKISITNGQTKVDITTGKLKADTDTVNNYLTRYKDSLNTFASTLIQKFNDIHKTGYSTNGQTGYDFFVGTEAKNITINPILSQDISKIATSASSSAEGNNIVAKTLSEVINEEVQYGMDFRNYSNSYSMGMAQDLNAVQKQVQIQEEVLNGMGQQKQSVEGVNLEEEMTNLMMFQKQFTANAKSIKVMQEVFQSLSEII